MVGRPCEGIKGGNGPSCREVVPPQMSLHTARELVCGYRTAFCRCQKATRNVMQYTCWSHPATRPRAFARCTNSYLVGLPVNGFVPVDDESETGGFSRTNSFSAKHSPSAMKRGR